MCDDYVNGKHCCTNVGFFTGVVVLVENGSGVFNCARAPCLQQQSTTSMTTACSSAAYGNALPLECKVIDDRAPAGHAHRHRHCASLASSSDVDKTCFDVFGSALCNLAFMIQLYIFLVHCVARQLASFIQLTGLASIGLYELISMKLSKTMTDEQLL
eukprot:6193959-Pleurochrysis_carterae.AAC.2